MSAISAPQRIELSPAVRPILEADTPKSQLLRHFLRYLEALLAPDPAGLDTVVTPDGRCHDLEGMGLPPGREGLKMFRRQVNAAIPDEHISVTAVRFEGDDIIEADMVMNATQTGELFGIPATGRTIHFDVNDRCRFVDGKLAELWSQVDFLGPDKRRKSVKLMPGFKLPVTGLSRNFAPRLLSVRLQRTRDPQTPSGRPAAAAKSPGSSAETGSLFRTTCV